MAFWDRFKKKAPVETPQPQVTQEPRPEDYIDLRVEVTTQEDKQLLFAARINSVQGDVGELYQCSDCIIPDDEEIENPIPVTLRGFLDKSRVETADNMAVTFTARISRGERARMWKAEEIQIASVAKGRAFFRLEVKVDAATQAIKRFDLTDKPCKLINISVGGACVATDQPFSRGDRFILKFKLLPDKEPSHLYCEVLRVTDKGRGKFEYGCRFVELDETARSRISQDIFAAQLAMRKKEE